MPLKPSVWLSSMAAAVAVGLLLMATMKQKQELLQVRRGPSGVPFVGKETVRFDKGLTKKFNRKIYTEILHDGLEVTDIEQGEGDAAESGDKVTVHYTGKLTNGKLFDSGDISFVVGAGQVIKGWDQGLQGMKVHGVRMLHIPPQLAYGSKGTPGGPIPPDATLLFKVKLLHVQKNGAAGSRKARMSKAMLRKLKQQQLKKQHLQQSLQKLI